MAHQVTVLHKIRNVLPTEGGLGHSNHVASFWGNDDSEIASMSVVPSNLFGLALV